MFGKQDGMYVRKPIEEDGHVLVIGGSGSGKKQCGSHSNAFGKS